MVKKSIKKAKMPHVFVLLTFGIAVCSLLTYLIPSGNFQRETKEINGHTRQIVVPNTYQGLEKSISLRSVLLGGSVEGKATPVGLVGFLSAVPRGMEQAADIIFFIFVIGGVFGIFQKSGVITASIHGLLKTFSNHGMLLPIIIMVAISIGGSTLGMGEEFIPLVPVFLLVSQRMGYDRLFGLAIVILSAQMGFAAATTNPFSLGVAKGIAGLDLLNGIWFRILFYLVIITITMTYILVYGSRVKRDPSRSLVANDPVELNLTEAHDEGFQHSHGLTLIFCAVIFCLVVYGSQAWDWGMAEMGGGFFFMGIAAVILHRMSLEEAAKSFVKGMEEMVVAALVVGFAKGISVVLVDAQVMDTLIHLAASGLQDVPKHLAVQGMFLFQTCFNFIVPSGSGQAAVTMPLMAPLSDLLGISREIAVFAFQCGDGFSNTVIPTSGILMSMLSLAKINYQTWLKFALPLFLILSLTSSIFLAIAVTIQFQ